MRRSSPSGVDADFALASKERYTKVVTLFMFHELCLTVWYGE